MIVMNMTVFVFCFLNMGGWINTFLDKYKPGLKTKKKKFFAYL